ncbi:thiamine-phosphate pyrophosphorylase [Hydrogenobacter thermophilus TK-6]|uniref:Thiamine-phosphate synthase n=1 Tax=Hydrogenobacter thermophilus (strain DSM 6534 / IAM 12695 / TK-6) TaxID=608538 RepID=D3DHF3_HYDTT|nr:thiamine phosphate synthase [Hydrogenobacter thermophilus]ADO45192.1 thiamine-phosphate pyrophosphorylase [Hydrogenobacter thermophilus TK-6]BAI69255.1 thiamine monophosphate synthase [Hydrogenobacter thermophilus TK-6]
MGRMNLSLYLVTDDKYFVGRDLVDTIEKALQGGVTALQYRFKNKSTRQMYEELLVLRELTRRYGADLVVNDRVDLAMAVGADGVHVGKEDLPPDVVRKIVGESMYIGYSVNSVEDLREVNHLPIDYIGFGSVYETTTKENYKLVGIEGLRQAVKLTSKPVVAIGGITSYRMKEVLQTGVKGVAVVSAILGFEDVEKAARTLAQIYKSTVKEKFLMP